MVHPSHVQLLDTIQWRICIDKFTTHHDLIFFITARQRSWRKVMFSQVSVNLFRGMSLPVWSHSWGLPTPFRRKNYPQNDYLSPPGRTSPPWKDNGSRSSNGRYAVFSCSLQDNLADMVFLVPISSLPLYFIYPDTPKC